MGAYNADFLFLSNQNLSDNKYLESIFSCVHIHLYKFSYGIWKEASISR